VAPTATARVLAIGPAVGRLDFFDSRNRDGFLAGFTARDGRYFPGYANAIIGRTSGDPASVRADNSSKFKVASVIDHETASVITAVAPDYVRVVTPVTSMLWESGTDQTRLKLQLGLTQATVASSSFRMGRDPDLATYDLVAEAESGDPDRAADAARMAAANLRLLAVAGGFGALNHIIVPDQASETMSVGFGVGADSLPLSRCLRDGAADIMFFADALLPILRCHLAQMPPLRNSSGAIVTLRPAVEEAIARLIGLYAVAIGVRPDDPRERGRWLLGIRGYLMPEVARIAADNNDASLAQVSQLATPDIALATQRYVDHYRYNPTGLFMPAPDLITMPAGTTRIIKTSLLTGNDLQFDGGSAGLGGLGPSSTLLSISVPAANQAEISVTRSGDDITITPAAGFRGVTFFDYRARGEFAEELTARVYVRVR
jgi:hypothetical protein